MRFSRKLGISDTSRALVRFCTLGLPNMPLPPPPPPLIWGPPISGLLRSWLAVGGAALRARFEVTLIMSKLSGSIIGTFLPAAIGSKKSSPSSSSSSKPPAWEAGGGGIRRLMLNSCSLRASSLWRRAYSLSRMPASPPGPAPLGMAPSGKAPSGKLS
jgi:hypothetical protein